MNNPIITFGIETLQVRIGGANYKHYAGLGYAVAGQKYITVKITDLPTNSGIKVPIVCPLCGKTRNVTYQKVNRSGHTACRSCEKHESRFKNVSRKRFGKLIAFMPVGKDKQNATKWMCHCDCGKASVVAITRLNNGMTSSCGCIRAEKTREATLGAKNFRFNPALTDADRMDRRGIPEYRNWRKAVKVRDGYRCKGCAKKRGRLAAHHLNSWDSFPEERFEISNGVTLCHPCHLEFHKQYGSGQNTRAQYSEWIRERSR